jgi:polyhydroxyalkanoate synthesis regulator protein
MVPAREPTTVKLYGNRRLYQPARGRYLTLDELMALADHGAAIIVRRCAEPRRYHGLHSSRSPTEQ